MIWRSEDLDISGIWISGICCSEGGIRCAKSDGGGGGDREEEKKKERVEQKYRNT